MKKHLLKALKIFGWVVASILLVLILLALSLNIPAVQNVVKNKAINYLKNKTKTEIRLQSIKIGFPKDVVLNNFYIEDRKSDTLLFAEKLKVNISLIKLLSNKVEINNIELKNIRANVKRINPDTSFNFSFLVDAFMSEQKKPDEKVQKDSTSTLKFSVNKILFTNIGLTYKDEVAGNEMKLYLGELKSRVKDFNLAKQHYVIKTLSLKNASLTYLQQKPLTQMVNQIAKSVNKTKKEKGILPLIEVQDFDFNNVKINYSDQLATTKFVANIYQLGLINLKANLTKSQYFADKATLSKSAILVAFKPNKTKKTNSEITDTTSASDLMVAINKANFSNNSFQLDNINTKPLPNKIDFTHLKLSKLNLVADNFYYGNAGIKGNIKSGSLIDRSGFILKHLQGNAVYSDKQIKLLNLILKTPNTNLQSTAALNYSDLNDFTKHPDRVKMSLIFNNSTIGLKDVVFFNNAIPANYRNEKLKINANLYGYLNNITVPKLQINGFKNTQIDISGKAKGLPNINKTYLDVTIKKFSLTKNDVLVFLPKKAIPPNLNLPNTLNAKGVFKGSITNFNTNLNIQTDMGNATVLAQMSGSSGKEKYVANIHLQNFNVGKLLKQQQKMGKINLRANVSGSGLKPKNINAKFNALVSNAKYNNYTYQNLKLAGTYANQIINLKSEMLDSNANFKLSAQLNTATKSPSLKANIALKQIDLQKLNFSDNEFKMAGLINANFSSVDVDHLNGKLDATKIQLVKNSKLINLDTIVLTASANAKQSKITFKSEILTATIDGKYQLSKIGNTLINQINKYYQFGETTKINQQRIKFAIQIYNSKVLTDFVPQLTTFLPSRISGLIDTQQDSLLLNAYFPKVVYGDFNIDSTQINVNNSNQKLNYSLKFQRLQSPSVAFFQSEISGQAVNNILDLNVFLRDSQRKNKYAFSAFFKSINKDYQFTVDPKQVILAYERWIIAPQNYIQFGKSGIIANQFNLSKNTQLLSINSETITPNAPLKIEFKNFEIETFSKFAETDTTLIGGTINGGIEAKDLAKTAKFESNLNINNLRYQKNLLGNLSILANNNTANAFEINAQLKGLHQISATGFYYTAPQSALNMVLSIDNLDLSKAEGISLGQIKQGKGSLTGKLSIKGKPSAPQILGDLNFNNAGFNVTYLNSYFSMPNQKLSFTSQGISFDNFTLIDSLNKKAVFDGMIYTQNFKNPRFDLVVKTNNFKALNSTPQNNNTIYGTLYLTSNVKIKGDLNQPNINANLRVNKGTKFFYALPINDPSVIDQEGIVQFIDADVAPYNGEKALKVDAKEKSPLKGINLVADITADPEAELNVIIDPLNGDALSVKGDANLTTTIDPSGKISLTGKYEITGGSYNLSVGPFTRKEFKLVKGSTIIWTGEPTKAQVNITALYEVNAAPIDLLNKPDFAQAKTKLPFQVYLMMKDELLKPIISFKIDLPENERGALEGQVYTQLQTINRDESELNKQVFALLALNRFVASNPFQSLAGGGGGVSTLARSSVSKLLTEQLNQLASSLFQGVDVNFGVNTSEDYSTGALAQKTDLEIGLSKKLLNDRLTVTIGSSFGLEGPQKPGQSSTNIAGNVNIDYALSPDGKYRLRFYRRNQNEGVIQGILETGLGFTMVVDYNKFKEIFQKQSKRNRTTLQQKTKNESAN